MTDPVNTLREGNDLSRKLPEIADMLKREIRAATGRDICFSLVVWTEGRVQYISNAQRPDVIEGYRRLLAGWEAGMPDVPAHEVQ
ncbi:hypothetical protein BCL74_2102 [Oceanibaculum indicum]|uniref:Uncharacterized protein n=2 Tax=Oceanibaculum indicum TaxID=526216 RepID=A0A420WGS6_9PROT|nr:hypothetical protein BCL74_2102 [Oceanibaculum indicum]